MQKVALVVTMEDAPPVILCGVPLEEASAAVTKIGRALMYPRFMRGGLVLSGVNMALDGDGVTATAVPIMTLDLRRVVAVNLAKHS